MSDNLKFELHESVFKNDVRKVAARLRTHDIAQKDIHGGLCLRLFLNLLSYVIGSFTLFHVLINI